MEDDKTNTTLNRLVGLEEGYLVLQNSTAVTIAHTKGHIFNKDCLKQALKSATDLHPNLRINTDLSKTPLEWKSVSNPYILPNIINATTEEEWKEIVNNEINEKFSFNLDRPLFRFTLVQYKNNAHLMIQYDHCIGDGVGGMILINTILTYYAQAYNGEEIEVKSLEFLPPSEVMAFPDGLNEKDYKIIEDLTKKLFEKKKDWFPHVNIEANPREDRKNYVLFQDGTEENLLLTKNMCKKYGVTVGSVIATAIFFTIAKYYKNDWENHPTINFDIDIDVNVRDRFPKKLGKKDLSLLYLLFTLDSDVNINQTFWELCKHISRKISDSLKDNLQFYQLYASTNLQTMPDIIENQRKNQERISNLNMSNIGPYPFNPIYKLKEGNEIILEKLNCGGSQWCPLFTGYVLLAHSVKYISYSFVYDELPENEETARLLFTDIIKLIEHSYDLEKFTLSDYINTQ